MRYVYPCILLHELHLIEVQENYYFLPGFAFPIIPVVSPFAPVAEYYRSRLRMFSKYIVS